MKRQFTFLLGSGVAALTLVLTSCSLFNATPSENTEYITIPTIILSSTPPPVVQQRFTTMKYEEVLSHSLGGTSYKVWVNGKKARMENADFVDPIWIYDMDSKVSYSYKVLQGIATKTVRSNYSTFADLEELADNPSEVTYLGDEVMEGVLCHVYQYNNSKWWINDINGLPVRYEQPNEIGILVHEYKNYEFNIDISDSMFQIPDDVMIVEKQ